MSQRRLAKHLGLDSSAVSLTFRGKREMKIMEAAQIAQLLGVAIDEVLRHAGVHEVTHGQRASIAGVIDASGEVRDTDEPMQVESPAGLPAGVIAIQSRAGDHTDGWLYFLRYPSSMNPEAVGRFSLVKIRNGVKTMALVGRSYAPGRYTLNGVLASEAADIEAAEPVLTIVP